MNTEPLTVAAALMEKKGRCLYNDVAEWRDAHRAQERAPHPICDDTSLVLSQIAMSMLTSIRTVPHRKLLCHIPILQKTLKGTLDDYLPSCAGTNISPSQRRSPFKRNHPKISNHSEHYHQKRSKPTHGNTLPIVLSVWMNVMVSKRRVQNRKRSFHVLTSKEPSLK